MTTMSGTETQVLPKEEEDISDFDGMAHYVKIKALIQGGPVVALCGKRYVPREIAKAQEYPTCPKCKELHGILGMMYGE